VSDGDGYRGLVVKPGDTVLIGLPDSIPEREFGALTGRLQEALPEDVKLVVLQNAQFAVYSPNTPPVEAPCGHD
jgi:hypothetical protein